MKPSESADVLAALQRILRQADTPLADTWGCTHGGHMLTIVERLGRVSMFAQLVGANAEMPGMQAACRRDLVEQIAELGANVLALLTEEMVALRGEDERPTR
jgi:hypothetical protein